MVKQLLLCWLLAGLPHVATAATAEQIKQLIADLGSSKFAVREEATQQLLAIGEPAALYLGDVVNSSDPEVRLRARQIMAKLGLGDPQSVDAKLLAEVDGLLDPVTRNPHPNTDVLVKRGAEVVPALIAVCKHEDNRKSVYAMIALTRIGDSRAFPTLARLFQVKHIAPHLRDYVKEIKDPKMLFHLIKTWQDVGDEASQELRSQVALMAGVKLEDDPVAWMKWFREKYGDKL